MKRALKIALLTLGVLFVLLAGAAIAIPYFFKDQILATIKDSANESLNATIDFTDVHLSLFRDFPDISVRLENLSVENRAPFEGIQLAAVESADLTVDIMSVIRNEKPMRVEAIRVKKPTVNIFVLDDGTANYNIVKPSADTATAEAPTDFGDLRINLKAYEVEDASVLYDDESMGFYLNIKGLNHRGSGDFTIDVYDLDTETRIDSLTVRYGGITYLKKAHTELDAIFNIDQRNSKYTLKDNNLRINELKLRVDGFVQMPDTSNIVMDLKASTPNNDFKSVLSMIPNAYIAGYENVKADGTFNLQATAKGTYNAALEQYPAFVINFGVEDGNVQYPALPLGISNINTKVRINSPTSNFDDMVVDVPNFSMKLGNNPFKAIFNLKTPISDPDINADVDGIINLKELAQAFPMESTKDLSGIIIADITAKTRMSYIDNQEYERVNMNGKLQVQNMKYRLAAYPAIHIQDAKTNFTPQNVRLENFDAKLGKSDVQASGYIDNILAYFSPKKTMTGQLTVRSNYFDANEWIPKETSTAAPAQPQPDLPNGEEATLPAKPFDRFDFSMDAAIGDLRYDIYQIENLIVKGNMKPNRLVAEDLSLKIGNSDLKAYGTITNLFDYLFDNKVLGGSIQVASNYLDLNQFMTASGTPTSATSSSAATPASTDNLQPFLVPANIDMDINADVKKLLYTNMEMTSLKGKLLVENEAVVIDEATANVLGGKVAIAGGYDTKDKENPAFSIKYDLQNMDFQKSFTTFNSFRTLAPVGEFIAGTFNTSLIMDGKLGKNMMPDFTSLSVQGFLETVNGLIQNFKPLQALGNQLNIDYFKESLPIKNTKNWFELKNGAIEVKEFDYKHKDIDMKISGSHSLAQEINYLIKAKIPRKLLEKTGVGKAANQGFDQLSKEASRFGLNLEKSEFVNVQFNLTGNIKNPKVGMKLLGADGTSVADSPTEAATDALKKEAEAKIEEGKQAIKETADKAIDSVKTVASQKVEAAKDTLGKKAEEIIKDKVGTAIDSTTKDKIKEELDKFNPFKKKKKNEGGGN